MDNQAINEAKPLLIVIITFTILYSLKFIIQNQFGTFLSRIGFVALLYLGILIITGLAVIVPMTREWITEEWYFMFNRKN